MKELVANDLVRTASIVIAGEGALKQKLQEQTADDLDLFFGHTGALAKKHEERIATVDDLFEVDELVCAQHQPEVLGQEQRLQAREQRVLRPRRNCWIGPREIVLDLLMLRAIDEESSQELVLQHLRGLHEAQLRLHQEEHEIQQDIAHLESERRVKEAGGRRA